MDIDCVIIGVNCELTLARCIQSLLKTTYTRGNLHLFYVDGGSTDNSVSVAAKFPGVDVVEMHPDYPTPGMGRNAGWSAGHSPLVHFFDSDVIVDPRWIDRAVDAISESIDSVSESIDSISESISDEVVPDKILDKADGSATPLRIAAVRGNRIELYPEASLFNWIGNMEWNAPPGESDSFGGDVLIQRTVLEQTNGYDEVLVAGEDPELSQRIRSLGWKIIQLDQPMCGHDLAMMKVKQYWKRAYRTGYGYAAVTSRSGLALLRDTSAQGFWVYELFRIIVRGGGFLFFTLLAMVLLPWSRYAVMLILPGLLLLLYPILFRLSWFMADKKLPKHQARFYAAHCSFVVLPEVLGVLRFFAGKIFNNPLRNRRALLKTELSDK